MDVNETPKENPAENVILQEIGFEIEITKDDSPTLRLIKPPVGADVSIHPGGESMHHTGGALSETCLIYGQAFQYGFEKHSNPKIVSLGLGLGYVEVLACAFSLLHNSSAFEIYSYESIPGLRKLFEDFYLKDTKSETYQWILGEIAKKYQLSPDVLRLQIKTALKENRLKLLGNFLEELPNLKSFDVFCYDAYSRKTSPELWDEVLMTKTFLLGSDTSCISSYASNAVLKKALSQAGFQFEVLEGFQGKRNRTWAYRA